jgi:hypothetical protein
MPSPEQHCSHETLPTALQALVFAIRVLRTEKILSSIPNERKFLRFMQFASPQNPFSSFSPFVAHEELSGIKPIVCYQLTEWVNEKKFLSSLLFYCESA